MAFRRRGPDREIEEFRRIVEPPEKFEDGFGGKAIVGALFLGLFMLPGSMYMDLFMGRALGPAARWVTVILFAEVARRSLKDLRSQEIFILFYMTGIALGSPFEGLLWRQYLIQSDPAIGMGIAPEIPSWVAPSADVIEETGRTFLNKYWIAPIALIGFNLIISRSSSFGLGYAIYRLTAHGEKLPFPMAPVGASGILSLTEDERTGTSWRWTAFATGGVIGIAFGFIYVGIPSLTGSILGTPYQLLPMPWLDTTAMTEGLLPATPTNIVFDMTHFIMGMVLPFWAVVGGFIGLLITLIANPLLYRAGRLPSWEEGMGVVDTVYAAQVDFYLSFSIGLMLGVFVISVYTIFAPFIRSIKEGKTAKGKSEGILSRMRTDKARGDLSIWYALLTYVIATSATVGICMWLLPQFRTPMGFLFFGGFGFVYMPIISYVTAKLEGMVGQVVEIPMVREAAFILSGYRGVAIWFAPIPMADYGMRTRDFRVMELTGTKPAGLIKTEFLCIPIVVLATVFFAEFIWRLGPIPSEAYPFTQEVWRLRALQSCLRFSATMEGGSPFMEAINARYIMAGLGGGVASYFIMSIAGLPTLLVFGVVRGLGLTTPGHVLPEIAGALVGRYYFRRRFGAKQWRRMVPVVFAGFTAGVGLVAMAVVGIAIIMNSVSPLLY